MVGGKWRKLDPNVKKVWFIKGFLVILLISTILGITLYFGVELTRTDSLVAAFGFAAAAIAVLATWVVLFYERYRFMIQEDGIEIKRGILWKKDITIPYDRVQNVDIDRGPIEQLIGVYDLNIFTAGTSSETQAIFGAEGYLPGVLRPEKVRNTILNRVQESEEDGFGITRKETKIDAKTQVLEEILDELKKIREKLD